MRDIVVVAAFWRSNYIVECLKHLNLASGIADKEIWVFQDDRIDLPSNRRPHFDLTTDLIASNHDLWRRFVRRQPHEVAAGEFNHACSYNVFFALREAYQTDCDFVYLVADDIFVTPDFFKWHEAVQRDGHFCTVAERAFRDFQPESKPFDLSAYYRAPTGGMDGGMCWHRDNLRRVIDYPSVVPQDHRLGRDLPEAVPMIPFVQRAYHVGAVSSHITPDGKFHGCGDTDPIPERMPHYEWDTVYHA
jgi:hypothetical protein